MDRRRFLALTGASAVGAAGGAGTVGYVIGRGEPEPAAAEPVPPHAQRVDVMEQPEEPRSGTHRVIWSVDTDERRAAISFDDGPDPEFTPRILDILDDAGVKATFVMMGYNVARNAELAREVVAAGHELGNHTWTHLNLLRETEQSQYEQLFRTADTIEEVTGQRAHYFRPPRGQLTGIAIRYAAVLGYDTLLWSITRGAPGESTPGQVADYVGGQLGPGDIIDLHDGIGRGTFQPDAQFADDLRRRREVEVEALPRILADAAEAGLALGTVSDLLATERRPLPPGAETSGA